METDANALRPGTRLEADVCIVGAGPAGLALAGALAGSGLRVCVLESGGRAPRVAAQALCEAEAAAGYGDLRAMRHRQIGGTAHLWNTQARGKTWAKYAPLEAVDFEARAPLALPGWPFGREELVPSYERAQALCGLGGFDYGPGPSASAGCAPLPLRGALESGVYQLGASDAFVARAAARVAGAPDVELVAGATACGLEAAPAGARVASVQARRLDGAPLAVRARRVVLAAGAIENARLLLLAEGARPRAGFDPYGQAGRGFMEHPRDASLRLRPARAGLFAEARFYDLHEAGGALRIGRLALRADALRAEGLPNASVSLLVPGRGVRGRLRALLARARLAPGDGAGVPTSPLGWSARAAEGARFDAFHLLLHLEQLPHPENRVALGTSRDALGVPRVRVAWRWREEEEARLERVRALVAGALRESGLGEVSRTRAGPPDPRAHHHAGTTRMSADPRDGVVDAQGRVHGVENLYVAGASVFPTAGFANPTLTIVALALRLAQHLRGRAS